VLKVVNHPLADNAPIFAITKNGNPLLSNK